MKKKVYTISALYEYVAPLEKAGFNVKLFDTLDLLYAYLVMRNRSDCIVISNMHKRTEGLNGGSLASKLMYGGSELEKIPVLIFSNGLTPDILQYELRLPNVVYKDIRPKEDEAVELIKKYIDTVPYYGNDIFSIRETAKESEKKAKEKSKESHQKQIQEATQALMKNVSREIRVSKNTSSFVRLLKKVIPQRAS